MAEFPALMLWTDSYLADTLHLSNAEHGVYLKFLMFAWRSPCCSLPDDDKRLARIAGVSPKAWATMKPVIMAFWQHEEGRYVQKRLTLEREKVSRQRMQKRVAGAASAAARALNANGTGATAVDDPLPRAENGEAATHNPSPKKVSFFGGGEKTESNRPPLGIGPYLCQTCDKPRLHRFGNCENCGALVAGVLPADKPEEKSDD